MESRIPLGAAVLAQRFSAPRVRCRDPLRHGASLIELLIVLFIIGVLCSLLFPALQAARGKALATACVNN